MTGFLYDLVHFFDSSQLAPHGVCLLWEPGLIWLHVLSDGTIGLAYFSIPIVLAAIIAKRPDLDFGWVLWAFVIFITACGATHLFAIWTLWFPDYAAEGAVKGLTAIVSILTAIGLWPLLPKVLALASPEQLQRANDDLKRQMDEREAALRALEREKSERRKAEELLRSFGQHREIERLVAVTPDAVIVVDPEGRVQCANEAAVNLFDNGAERLVGGTLPFPIKAGEIPQIEVPGRGQQVGEIRVADCEWGDAPARLVVIRDITERKRIERLKDEFVSTVSHELRTPITSIVGSLGLLVGKAAGALPEQASRLLAIALRNSQRLTELVNEILDLSKMESGEATLRQRSIGDRASDRGDAGICGELRRGDSAGEFFSLDPRLRRPRSVGPGGHQSPFQCDQVLAARTRGRGRHQGQRIGGSHIGARLGPRYPGQLQAADIRESRAGGRIGRTPPRRQRARPQYRQAYRGAARRHRDLRGCARRGHRLPCRSAPLRRDRARVPCRGPRSAGDESCRLKARVPAS